MNLAAITPAALLGYLSSRVFRFFFYAFLKLGKSREEVYATFRHTLTDIERLLVMRDNPPNTPGSDFSQAEQSHIISTQPSVLGSDDLGMLMLLVHECRSILWRDRRRFTEAEIRSVNEDLAELAGERGKTSFLCLS
jgi:ATP synthase regulation protein NCA2